MTMLGAVGLEGFSGFMTVDAPTDGEVFRAFVLQELVRHIKRGDIVVMDNLGVHRDAEAIRAIRAAGATVLYLPPYSPEFNPIEKAWAKIKEIIRRVDTITREAFENAVATAIEAISPDDILAWVLHAGYRVS